VENRLVSILMKLRRRFAWISRWNQRRAPSIILVASIMVRLSALRLRDVFKVRVATRFKLSRAKSSGELARADDAVVSGTGLGGAQTWRPVG
jgi:hypothetical protein